MKTLTTNTYPALVKHVQRELQELDFFVKHHTVETYWRIGKYISEHLLEHKDRAGYGKQILERLAGDVDRDVSTLCRTLKFYRAYPILARGPELNWSHYRVLITVKDKAQRNRLEKDIVRNNLAAEKLKGHVLAQRANKAVLVDSVQPIPQLAVTRGQLLTYEVIELAYPESKQMSPYLDLGFQMRRPFPENKSLRLKEGTIVEARATNGRYSFSKTTAAAAQRFTYKAQLLRVVDGDTLWVNIDTGLGMLIKQKLRLRGIDCPEIDTPEGKRAKRFVQSRLKDLEWLIVKTHKDTTDKYDRYLADIFFLSDEPNPQKVAQEGRFLNQELLDVRLATVYPKSSI